MMRTILFCALVSLIISCNQSNPTTTQYVFELLDGEDTGIDFNNELTPTLDLNVFNYMYFYNGGGVCVGDFNQDDLPDLYFTGNMVENRLYLNEGDLKFRDVTQSAGVAGQPGWTSGATSVDINQDGLLDIYVSQMGKYRKVTGHNQLYVCTGIENGVPKFEERSKEYGLDLIGFSTQAGFFDYDRDGDLDLFQLRYSLHQNGTFGQRKTFTDPHDLAGDRLYRNDDGKFVDVTTTAGIYSTVIGYGLGIAFSDLNRDGWPDLYIGNDFHENDYLYINQQDGTFKEVLNEQINHTSRFSMGVDIADINNDGHSEIISLDMLPYDPVILKSSLGEDSYGIFQFKLGYGYNHQYARNNLQLNNANNTYSDIAMFSGVHATDWSWAPLFLDFDNDGYRDLFITNGIPRRMNDIDYVNFYSNDDIQAKVSTDNMEEQDLSLTEKLPRIKLPNRVFRNNGDLRFSEIGALVKNNQISFSNGAAYADLDLDGDLDIITNNIENNAFVYQNLTRENNPERSRFIRIKFDGKTGNIAGIGARVIAFSGDQEIHQEQFPVRGFQSSVDRNLLIGLGSNPIDSLHVIWPDGTMGRYDAIGYDTTMVISHKDARLSSSLLNTISDVDNHGVHLDATSDIGLDFQHEENPFIEFHREQLIPFMVSTSGPCIAVGDVNGDDLEDVFFGNAKRKKSALYLQQANGRFKENTPDVILLDSLHEDVDAHLVDIDLDGDLDLLVASGGNEFRLNHSAMQQRIYINDGNGNLSKKDNAFGGTGVNASCIEVADFDLDGDPDVFIGARSMPWGYGNIPESYLFLNDGNGNFSKTEDRTTDLKELGFVTDAEWTDLDNDGDMDLAVALEWGPVTFFMNDNGNLTKSEIGDTEGWWKMIQAVDMDQDGDVDLVAGNTGLNHRFRVTKEEPIRMYVNDFDSNGQIEQLLTSYVDGKELLFQNYAEMTSQMPSLKKKFLYAKDFAETSFKDYFEAEIMNAAKVFEATELRNCWFENQGNGQFKKHVLDDRLQFAPIMSAAPIDLNQDGKQDLVIGGNFYENNIEMGRYDADYGHVWINQPDDLALSQTTSLNVRGQLREIKPLTIQGKTYLILGFNNGDTKVLKPGTQESIQ